MTLKQFRNHVNDFHAYEQGSWAAERARQEQRKYQLWSHTILGATMLCACAIVVAGYFIATYYENAWLFIGFMAIGTLSLAFGASRLSGKCWELQRSSEATLRSYSQGEELASSLGEAQKNILRRGYGASAEDIEALLCLWVGEQEAGLDEENPCCQQKERLSRLQDRMERLRRELDSPHTAPEPHKSSLDLDVLD